MTEITGLPTLRLLCLVLAVTGALGARAATSAAPAGTGLTGDWSGRRPTLARDGIAVGLTYTLAALGTVDGGLRRGALLEGSADLSADLDFGPRAGWPGTTGRLSLVAAHGPSVTAKYVGDVRYISDYDMPDGIFFHEAWLEHTWGEDLVSLRAGKLSADVEFPLYGTGDSIPLPLYPVGALGARLRISPSERWAFEAALYDGDPFGPGRARERRGLNLRLSRHEGATFIGAVHLRTGVGGAPALPPGTWKFGVYRTSRDVADIAAGPDHRGSHAFFVDVAQTLWRERPGAANDTQGLDFYATTEIAQPDRTTYRASVTAGLARTGLLPGRDADILDVSFYYTRFSRHYSRGSLDAGGPAFTAENVLRVFYQIALSPDCTLQPQVDHVIRPGGTGEIPSATVLSLRATVTF